MAKNYEIDGYNPMATYKEIGINACIASHTPILLLDKSKFISRTQFCQQFIDDLFEIVSPRCTQWNDGKVNDSNPCTALYGHVSDQIVNRPEMDAVLFTMARVFTDNSSRTIGNDFDHYLKIIGHDNIRDTWINLSRKYHFFAAFYVGCELKTRGYSASIVEFATSGIGYVYESQDFLGHLFLENVSWQESSDNFLADTEKYRLGGKLANQLC